MAVCDAGCVLVASYNTSVVEPTSTSATNGGVFSWASAGILR